MVWPGGSSGHRQVFQGSQTRMDHQNGGTILHRARFYAVATKFLGTIRLVSVTAGFEAQEKHARVLLAHRSPERHSLAAKHRTQCALVLHRASRTWARILFQSIFAPGSALFVTAWCSTGLS